MTDSRRLLPLLLIAVTIAVPLRAQDQAIPGITGAYEVMEKWFNTPRGRHHHIAGVLAENSNRIIVTTTGEVPEGSDRQTQRAQNTPGVGAVFALDATGRVVEEWTQWAFQVPHKVRVNSHDADRHVWIVDRAAQQVFKFTRDGKRLVMTLGEKNVPGTDATHFSKPADIAFLPDGSFFVVEEGQDDASRVAKFDKNGKFQLAWGSKGSGPGQFNLAHGIAVDPNGRVYVAEQNNNRVQIFDQNGKYLHVWPDIRGAADVVITKDAAVWVTSITENKLAKYDLNGTLLGEWGGSSGIQGGLNRPHQISVEPNGNLFIADSGNDRVLKFKPRAGVDRDRLVGPLY